MPKEQIAPIIKLAQIHDSEEVLEIAEELGARAGSRGKTKRTERSRRRGPNSRAPEANEPLAPISPSRRAGHCMAYMRHERLVRLLKSGWKATCTYKQVLRKKSFKVVARLEADNKTDAEELEEARRKRDEVDHNCALANLKLYKMVALNHIMEENPPGTAEGEEAAAPEEAK